MINSTVSRESAPRSLVKLASATTSDSSTPSLSTIIAFTFDSTSCDITICVLLVLVVSNLCRYNTTSNRKITRLTLLIIRYSNTVLHRHSAIYPDYLSGDVAAKVRCQKCNHICYFF